MNVSRWLVYCHTHCDLPLDYRYHKFFHQSYVTYLFKNNKDNLTVLDISASKLKVLHVAFKCGWSTLIMIPDKTHFFHRSSLAKKDTWNPGSLFGLFTLDVLLCTENVVSLAWIDRILIWRHACLYNQWHYMSIVSIYIYAKETTFSVHRE